ncbi:uncharacterized protein LOC114579874 [Dendrobium catenatum]|uniref:uncharacterized protein LOC114579874 n=1 Tax=Dendrobium catenatum TaxID=906689 RepID=UPI00109FE1FA|nr:uncharacterized protein LOC114579874 [Dendrobium catenatum]
MRKLTKSDFLKVVRAVSDKINVWGRRHLSLAGRATLIRSSLLTIPMYLITHTNIPTGTLNAIERMARQFMWQKEAGKRGLHYVSWSDLCRPTAVGGLGFHASATWQGPLRARLAWNVVHDRESLLGRTILARYGTNLWGSSEGRSASITWKVLREGAAALRPILRWNIWDGSKIDILEDTWIANRCLARWPSFVAVDTIEGCTVGDFLDENLDWQRERVLHSFGPALADYIFGIPTRVGQGEDCPELINSQLGTTISALAYKENFLQLEYNFLWFKKFHLHPREHMFWWRITRGAIPTNSWLYRRGLVDLPNCPWGCNCEETVLHLTAHCEMLISTHEVLAKWGFSLPRFQNWEDMINGLALSAKQFASVGRLYCYVVYQVWRARNDKMHGRTFGTPAVLAANSLAMLPKSLWAAFFHSLVHPPPPPPPPPPGWVKFNVDASVRPNAVAGLGVVARDHVGKLLLVAGSLVEQWDVTRAEILAATAIRAAVEDWMFNMDGIIIEGDCRNAIKWLQGAFNRLNKLHLTTEGPDLSFLLDFRQVLFSNVPRQCNQPADFCADYASFGNFMWKACDDRNEPKNFDFSQGAGGVLKATSAVPWSASFMVETRTISDRLRSPNFRS